MVAAVFVLSVFWSSPGFQGLWARITAPSGRQLYSLTPWGRELNWRASPPLIGKRKICGVPVRSLRKARVRPSGDQRGCVSCCSPLLICQGAAFFPPLELTNQMLLLVLFFSASQRKTVKAIKLPSGEI